MTEQQLVELGYTPEGIESLKTFRLVNALPDLASAHEKFESEHPKPIMTLEQKVDILLQYATAIYDRLQAKESS